MDIRITVNGEARTVADGTTVSALIEALDLGGSRIAVEVDGAVVPRSAHATHALADGARVEIVHAIGGG